MKTVRIVGTSRNMKELPPAEKGVELWPQNDLWKYGDLQSRISKEWTRWFNLHARAWMEMRYPRSLGWHIRQDGRRPFYTQTHWPDIPGCRVFPRKSIQAAFATSRGPNRYFTCTVAWCMALAIVEGFSRIELWGFAFGDKRGEHYARQRPCFFYWVDQARARGIVVTYQKEVHAWPHLAGDADTYKGPIYGYDTKPEGKTPTQLARMTL